MTERFEMWVLLKLIAIGEISAAILMLYLLVAELHGMARVVPAVAYSFVGLVLLWTAVNSIVSAHKCYSGFYNPNRKK